MRKISHYILTATLAAFLALSYAEPIVLYASQEVMAAPRVIKTDVYGRELDSRFFFWRNVLYGDLEQALYNKMYASAMAYETNIPILFDITPDRALAVFQAVRNDNPEIFWLENYFLLFLDHYNRVVEIELVFTVEPDLIPAQRERFRYYADSVLAQAMKLNYDGEKVRFIFDLLVYFVEYDLGMISDQSAFGAMVYNRAVCMGYAMAFTYFMQRLGIPAATVIGVAGGEYHAWNMVYLGGRYFNLDITWEATSGAPAGYSSFNWFLLSDRDLSGHVRDAACRNFPQATGGTDTLRALMELLPARDFSQVNFGRR